MNLKNYNFTGYFFQSGNDFIGICPEIEGANGQGATIEEARESLRDSIKLIIDYRKSESLESISDKYIEELIEL